MAQIILTEGAAQATPGSGTVTTYAKSDGRLYYKDDAGVEIGPLAAGLADGDKGDITVSASGATWTIDSSAVTTSKIADSSITNAKLAFDGGALSCRNKLIGGDFTTNPWQLGTSFPASASGSYTADMWNLGFTSSGVVSVLKTADAPTATQAGTYTQHCIHIDVTTADAAVAAGDNYNLNTRIEGLNSASFGFGQSGTRYVTLSFWHKHTKTGTNCIAIRNSASDRSYVAEYTQAVSDTWEKAIVTIPVDTSGTWLYDTGIGLILTFSLMGGTTVQTTANTWTAGNFTATSSQVNNLDSTANNFKIALVQLESGQTATSFETLSVGDVLMLCSRYLPVFNSSSTTSALGLGSAVSTSSAVINIPFSVPPRIVPTGITISGATHLTVNDGTTLTASTAVVINATTSSTIGAITVTTAAVLTQFRFMRCQFNTASGQLIFTGATL